MEVLEGPKHHKKLAHRINEPGPIGVHRGWIDRAWMAQTDVLCIYVMVVKVGMGASCDLFAYFWNPFSPVGLPCPALLWGYLPSLTITWYAMFGWNLWRPAGRGNEWERLRGGGRQDHNWNSLLPMIPNHLLHSSSTICSQLHLIRAPIHTFNVYKLQGEAILRICYEIKCSLGSVTKNGISPHGF